MSWEFIIFTSVEISDLHIEFFDCTSQNKIKKFRKEKVKPDAGLEPATARLRVWCSTDWANRAVIWVARESDRGWGPLCVQLSTFNKDDTNMIPKLQKLDFPQVSMCGSVILLLNVWQLKHGWWESTFYLGFTLPSEVPFIHPINFVFVSSLCFCVDLGGWWTFQVINALGWHCDTAWLPTPIRFACYPNHSPVSSVGRAPDS